MTDRTMPEIPRQYVSWTQPHHPAEFGLVHADCGGRWGAENNPDRPSTYLRCTRCGQTQDLVTDHTGSPIISGVMISPEPTQPAERIAPEMRTRPGREKYYLDLADVVGTNADCTRRGVGAIIVKDNRIMATGYNGYPSGAPGCLTQGACPRGRHWTRRDAFAATHCGCGQPLPCPDAAPGYAQGNHDYTSGASLCDALHAEENAASYCSYEQRKGATMYISAEPCNPCLRHLGGSGLASLVWREGAYERIPSHYAPEDYATSYPKGTYGVWGRIG